VGQKKRKKNKTSKVFCFRKKNIKKRNHGNYDCDISRMKKEEKKNRNRFQMEIIFLCLCMLCINQIFLILAPGLMIDPFFYSF